VQTDPLAALSGLPAWQATLLVLGASLAGAVLLEVVVLKTARRAVATTESAYDDILIGELRLPVVVSAALVGVYLLTRSPTISAGLVLAPATLATFFGKPALSLVLVTWAVALNRLVNRLVATANEQGAGVDFAPILSNVWTLAVAVGTVGSLLALWGIDVTPLLAGAGIAGIAVGFAAKDTVANFFGGVALYFDDTYKLGDYIELDSGEAGTVIKVGVRSTTLLTRDEVTVTVPNSVLNATRVTNQSAPQRRRRVRVPVGVAYGTDVDAFEALALEVAAADPLVLKRPKPRLRLRRLGDFALEYELLVWVAGPTRRAKAIHRLNRALYTELTEAGIEIPFPQRVVRMQSDDAGSSALDGSLPDEPVSE
jgi:small-conductance mechanosensitive channel